MKESQYRPDSIRGKRPVKPDDQDPEPQQGDQENKVPQKNPYDATLWDVTKSPFQGFFHGFLGTGLQNRQQLMRQKERENRGLPPAKYRRQWIFNPFRRADNSSWFKDACDHKPMD